MEKFYEKYWQVVPCFTGIDCWCKMIATVDWNGISDSDIVIGASCVNHKMATHLVTLHNESLAKKTL
jgi:hypothetical protein